jgi:hypothetical protein
METIEDHINESLVLIIDRDKVKEFANIIVSLSKDYSLTTCCYSNAKDDTPGEIKVSGWETEEGLVALIGSLCPDHRIVCLIHHKRKGLNG